MFHNARQKLRLFGCNTPGIGEARLGAAVGDVVTGKNSVHNVQFFNHFSSSYTRMKFLKLEDDKRAERR